MRRRRSAIRSTIGSVRRRGSTASLTSTRSSAAQRTQILSTRLTIAETAFIRPRSDICRWASPSICCCSQGGSKLNDIQNETQEAKEDEQASYVACPRIGGRAGVDRVAIHRRWRPTSNGRRGETSSHH